MRGAHERLYETVGVLRIIPADAGSTAKDELHSLLGRDHPRGCGEHMQASSIVACNSGSSPRMRGARLPYIWEKIDMGIIPADAGSTACTPMNDGATWDHPRGCGEHLARLGVPA